MAVLAVSSEPLSPVKFPANREFYREISIFGLSFAHVPQGMPNNPGYITRHGGPSGHKKNRECFSRHQGNEFPVNASEKPMDTLAPLSGRTLIIVAHPDDEAVTCGSLMQRMREPHVLFCTDGAPLDPYFWSRYDSREAYSLLRQKEARLALSRQGVTSVEFLKIQSGEHIIDQHLFERLPGAIEAVFQVVSRVCPEALLTLADEGIGSREQTG